MSYLFIFLNICFALKKLFDPLFIQKHDNMNDKYLSYSRKFKSIDQKENNYLDQLLSNLNSTSLAIGIIPTY